MLWRGFWRKTTVIIALLAIVPTGAAAASIAAHTGAIGRIALPWADSASGRGHPAASPSGGRPHGLHPPAHSRTAQASGNTGLMFIENVGQFPVGARFQAPGIAGSAPWLA